MGGVRQHCLRWHARIQPTRQGGMRSVEGHPSRATHRRAACCALARSSWASVTCMRVSGSICSDETRQLQARRSSPSAGPTRLRRLRAWHNCSVAASPPHVQLMCFPADSSSVVGTREALEHPVGWMSAPSASILGGHTLASRQTVAACGQLRLVSCCGGHTHAHRRCLPSPWGSRRTNSWLARARRCCATCRR